MKLVSVLSLCLLATTACVSSSKSKSYIKENAASFDGMILPAAMIEDKKVVLFGEGHGIKELPQIFYSAVEDLAKKQSLVVGLEFPKDVQSKIETFFKNGRVEILTEIPFFKDPAYHSGRASLAMIVLLKKLRELKNVEPFCFDVSKSDSTSKNRDTLMAKNVIEKVKSSGSRPIILLTGNIHSRLTPGVPWDSKYPTMGSEILALSSRLTLNNVTNILFRYNKGSSWQCRMENKKVSCRDFSFGSNPSPYSAEVGYDSYFLKEQMVASGHYNTLFIREVGASAPYFK